MRAGFDAADVERDVRRMQRTMIESGATVLGFTLPEFSGVAPLARLIAPRIRALNDALRSASAATGAILVDFATYPVASDPRLWSKDRLHANAVGHARIAAALAWALELPGTDEEWSEPLAPPSPPTLGDKLAAEIAWGRDYFLPWVWRHMRGRSSGDGVVAKRPALEPVTLPGASALPRRSTG